ncbi:arrestin [Pleomassaria siparia CBS 279.74]|uniref:Arrestin n=1 Tax=Pleomassaria siparia CBS 279.74 TaxID=1314801 RepID=A0A6G1KM58_9PLEO|nr:arrestin [Pleomassaria siparia CBS 279.74]
MANIAGQIGYKVRNITHYGQPTIEINLDNAHGTHGTWVTSYSTMDTIEGTVTITVNHDTKFENMEISFVGTSQVFVDRLTSSPSMSGRTEATHRFLTLKQPMHDDDLPCPRRFEVGKVYTFPFYFTVPAHLLPRACAHTVASDHVRDMHMMLPPSMGDPSLAGFGDKLLDDLAPEMSKVIYGIKVRIVELRESDGKYSLLGEKIRKVRIKPAFEEQPPLNPDPSDPEYRPRQEKTIRKGLFKGKLGTLIAQSAQPKALVIPGARTTNDGSVTTMAKMLLRFDPADETNAPPRLGSLATKVKVSTYYASAPRANFPTRATLGYDLTQGIYTETISLSSLCIASGATWEKQGKSANPTAENDILRRDSGYSTSSSNDIADAFNNGILTASKNYRGGSFYTAKIAIPVTLPKNKNFLPTFHTCLISRTYVLSLHVSAHAPGFSDPSLRLKVPMQVCADGSDTGIEVARARSVEEVIRQEANQVFLPSSTATPTMAGAPGVATRGGAQDLPPEYAAYAPRVGRCNVRVTAVG